MNPIATADQRALEDVALRLMQHPDMVKARSLATLLWREATAYPAGEQISRFDNMIDEYLFYYAMRTANSDAAYPKVLRFMQPPHRWFGRAIPGSRWGGDSPDFTYRVIPIAHGGRYEIRGERSGSAPPTVNYSLMGDNTASPVTQCLLDSLDMSFEADGSFLITIDGEPGNGRPNHIQTRAGADFLMIRDALLDWTHQQANDLAVVRLGPGEPRKSEDEMARHYAKIALDGVYYTYYCTQSANGRPRNEMRPATSSAAYGGMATQWSTKGTLLLEDDDAIIVTANEGGALFRNIQLTDFFHMSLEYWQRSCSFNMRQMAADEDGRFTFVVAHRDPGIHNWLDTGRLRQVMLGHRWQSIPGDYAGEKPYFAVQSVKFDELEKKLPVGVLRIDAAGREMQIASRAAGFARRFLER